MTNIFEGRSIRLRAVEPDDWQTHHDWNRLTDVARNTYLVPFPQSTVAVQRWAQDEATKDAGSHDCRLQIETLDGVLVGTINSHHCDQRTGTFSYGLAILPAHQRKGYATEAIFLLLRYFFLELRYQKVTVEVYAFNTGSAHLHERLGFVQEGRLRRMVYTGGEFHDLIYYGMTRKEFDDLHLPDNHETL